MEKKIAHLQRRRKLPECTDSLAFGFDYHLARACLLPRDDFLQRQHERYAAIHIAEQAHQITTGTDLIHT